MLSAKLILTIAAVSAIAWECGVTHEWERKVLAELPSRHRVLAAQGLNRNITLGPIRIIPFYVSMGAMSSAASTRLQTITMPSVLKWYSKVLSVKNVAQTFTISAGICGSSVPIPVAHQQTGVSGADIILYVTTSNDPTSNAISAAIACATDAGNRGNPVVGMLNINVAEYNSLTSVTAETDVLRHQIAHVLAFSGSLFPRFTKPDGSLFTAPIITTTAREHSVMQLATPKVIEKAKAAYNCSTLTGLELENGGGNGIVGSHWEKRIMSTEFMMGVSTDSPIFSDITLAVFEDSGWYVANYTYAEQIVFGKDKGCDFFNKKCVIGGVPQFPEFCATTNAGACDITATFKSSCRLGMYNSALPSPYQYFSDPKIGGLDDLMDYCPATIPYTNGDCTGKFTTSPPLEPYYFGEKACENCRCFTGTHILSGWSMTDPNHASCLEVACENGVAYVILANKRYACPANGGTITNLSGFTGYINCPKYQALCTSRPCPNDCSGNGVCAGSCKCDNGFWDAACSSVCHASCRGCSGSTDSSCTSCKPSNAVLSGGMCSCPVGFYMTSDWAQCLSCVTNCASCTGAGSCTTCKDGFYLSADKKSCIVCDSACTTCTGAGTCAKCKAPTAVLIAGKCKCVDGYYMKSDNTQCVACDAVCKTCTGTGSCVSCKAPTAVVSAGKCTCANGYYMKSDNTQCVACDAVCNTCKGTGSCDTCRATNAVFSIGKCSCANGYYMKSDYTQCVACDISCKTCIGAESCTGTGSCDICKAPTAVVSAGKCICTSGYYMKSDYTQCIACDSSCSTCTGTGSCSTCKAPTAVLIAGKCSCADGYYMKSDNSQCIACDPTCNTCSGAGSSSCTTCKPTAPILTSGKCGCASGYFLAADGVTCSACNASCKTCSGALSNQCTSCNSPNVLRFGSCTMRFLEPVDGTLPSSDYDIALVGVAVCGWILALVLLFGRQKVAEEVKPLVVEEGFWMRWKHSHLLLGFGTGDGAIPRACKPIILTATIISELTLYSGSWLSIAACLGVGALISAALTTMFTVKGFRAVGVVFAAIVTAIAVLRSFDEETQWEGYAVICAGELLIGQSLVAFERVFLRKLRNY